MPKQQQGPLSDAACTTLDCVLRRVAELKDFAAKCQNCGLDVSAAIEELNRQEQLATAMKANFFPNRP